MKIKMRGFTGFPTVLTYFIFPTLVLANEYRLTLVPTPNPKKAIIDLKWDESRETQEPVIQITEAGKEGSPYFVKLQGHTPKIDSNLIFDNQPIHIADDGRFTIEVGVGVESEHQEFEILEIDNAGKITQQESELLFPNLEQFKADLKAASPKKWSISPGLGVTLATYQQSGLTSFTETALTLKVTADYSIVGPWDIGGSAYYTALPLTTSQKGLTLTFLGLNLRAGFRLLKPESTWGVSIMGGIYYTTTFASSGFGYRNLQGLQIYPVLTRKFADDKSAWLYLKYSPIFDGTDFVSFNNAEFAVGGGFAFKTFSKGNLLAATVDVAFLSLPGNSVSVQSNTYSLGVSYRF